jgi:hypothetical protein
MQYSTTRKLCGNNNCVCTKKRGSFYDSERDDPSSDQNSTGLTEEKH